MVAESAANSCRAGAWHDDGGNRSAPAERRLGLRTRDIDVVRGVDPAPASWHAIGIRGRIGRVMRLLRKQGDVPKRSFWQRVKDVALMDVMVLAKGGVSVGSLEQLEQVLLESDFGVPVTLRMVEEVERK